MARKSTKTSIEDLVQTFSNYHVGDPLVEGTKESVEASPIHVPEDVTPEDRKALDDVRNSKRGRKGVGEKKSNYKLVAFQCDMELLEKFEMIPYKVTKTKKELFEEALQYIIDKYGE